MDPDDFLSSLSFLDVPDQNSHQMNPDEFLSSLSFLDANFCDCDECDLPSSTSSSKFSKKLALDYNNVPLLPLPDPPLKDGKDLTVIPPNSSLTSSLQPPQKRKLLARDNLTGISIWKLTIPIPSKPLMEFGYNHKIVYVETLPLNASISLLQRNDSTSKVTPMKCNSKYSYFLRSNGEQSNVGQGWIACSSNGNSNSNNNPNKIRKRNHNPLEEDVRPIQSKATTNHNNNIHPKDGDDTEQSYDHQIQRKTQNKMPFHINSDNDSASACTCTLFIIKIPPKKDTTTTAIANPNTASTADNDSLPTTIHDQENNELSDIDDEFFFRKPILDIVQKNMSTTLKMKSSTSSNASSSSKKRKGTPNATPHNNSHVVPITHETTSSLNLVNSAESQRDKDMSNAFQIKDEIASVSLEMLEQKDSACIQQILELLSSRT